MDTVNILLVDDEPKNLTALDAVLSGPDRRLVFAHSGADALRALLREQFAVVLLDVNMPGMDGFETASLMRGHSRSRSTPIIFLTAANKEATHVSRGYALGAVDYIFKPFDIDILRSKVAVFVDLCRKTQQVRRQAQELSDTSEFLENVLQSTTDYAITAQDLKGRIVAWYEGARRLYGFTREEAVGSMHTRDLYAPEELESGRIDELLETARREGRSEGMFQQVRKDGSRFTASVTVNPRTGASTHVNGYVLVAKDVTHQVLQEEQARQLMREQFARAEVEASNRRFALLAAVSAELPGLLTEPSRLETIAQLTLLDLADVCCIDLSKDGRIERAAAAWRDPSQECIAQALAPSLAEHSLLWRTGDGAREDFVPADDSITSLMSVPIRGHEGLGGTLWLISTRIERQFEQRDLDFAEDLAARLGLALDNAALYRNAQEALQARDDFFSSAYHDLRTPLTVIKGHAQLLHVRASHMGEDGKRIIDGLNTISTAATRINRMIDEMLDMARLQSGRKLALNREPVDLIALAHGTASQFPEAEERLRVVVDVTPGELIGEWDPDRLDRVLGNLLGNAIAYSPRTAPITLAVCREEDKSGAWAVVRVEDQGLGIPPGEIERVFDRYFRASNVSSTTYGTGIGLAGVKQIVEDHQGVIALSSREGQGTTVEVRLPLKPVEQRPPAENLV